MEAMLTMEPEPRSSMARPASRQPQNTPSRFTEIMRRHSSSVISSAGTLCAIPALLTITSIFPCRSSTARTISRPRPPPAPVTTATRSCNEKSSHSISLLRSSPQGVAAVHDEHGSRHEAGGVAGQVDQAGTQLLRHSVALHGGVFDPVPPEPGLVHRCHRRLDVAGGQGVHAYVVGCPLRRERPG